LGFALGQVAHREPQLNVTELGHLCAHTRSVVGVSRRGPVMRITKTSTYAAQQLDVVLVRVMRASLLALQRRVKCQFTRRKRRDGELRSIVR
jgi:hypothetical protein